MRRIFRGFLVTATYLDLTYHESVHIRLKCFLFGDEMRGKMIHEEPFLRELPPPTRFQLLHYILDDYMIGSRNFLKNWLSIVIDKPWMLYKAVTVNNAKTVDWWYYVIRNLNRMLSLSVTPCHMMKITIMVIYFRNLIFL